MDRRKHTFRIAIWIFLTFLFLYIPITRGHFISSDEVAMYKVTESIWEKGSLTVKAIPHSFIGKNGNYYTKLNVGQSVAALPLYGIGNAISNLTENSKETIWIKIFEGPLLGQEDFMWGGDIRIFFVNLFHCFTTAMLCSVFFLFSVRMCSSHRYALLATVLLGLTTYIAPFSTGFYQHSSEALFLLSTFYFLYKDSQHPHWKYRALAGAMFALMLLFRFQSIIALPGLLSYLSYSVWKRVPRNQEGNVDIRKSFMQIFPFIIMSIAGLFVHLLFNYIKLGTWSFLGGYKDIAKFTNPLKGLYGLLLSPGESIFLYTPLLLLLPWTLKLFYRKYTKETLCIIFIGISYLIFYGSFIDWHGMYCYGPRYLAPITAILLLPLCCFMENIRRKGWFVLIPLALIGFWMQVTHVAVNFWYVVLSENYLKSQPQYGFLFIPDVAPFIAHTKALLSADDRVDMWLVNVYREFGFIYMFVFLIPFLIIISACVYKLIRIAFLQNDQVAD